MVNFFFNKKSYPTLKEKGITVCSIVALFEIEGNFHCHDFLKKKLPDAITRFYDEIDPERSIRDAFVAVDKEYCETFNQEKEAKISSCGVTLFLQIGKRNC